MESLQRLRVLREIAINGSFSAAGRALSLSQPAVSQHISQLERELGTTLVERSVKGARLTPGGEIALEHALQMLRTADLARRELDAHRSGAPTHLAITGFSSACTNRIPEALGDLRRHLPHSTFELHEADVDEAIDAVVHSRSDLALAFDYAAHPLDARGLVARHLGDDPVAVVLPQDHPCARRPVVPIEALVDEVWIGGTGFGCLDSLRTVCGAAGFEPEIVMSSNRYPTTMALVGAGIGIALVPRTVSDACPASAVALPLSPAAPPRRLWSLTSTEPRPIAVAMADALMAVVRQRTA
jgi:molybdate transport repressor ModE-like protein